METGGQCHTPAALLPGMMQATHYGGGSLQINLEIGLVERYCFTFFIIKFLLCTKQKTSCVYILQHLNKVVILQSSFCVTNVECFQQLEVLACLILHIQVMCGASLVKPFASHPFSAAIKMLYTTRLVPHLHLESRIRMNTATPQLPYMPS
jgi:hypothetical protein